MSTESPVAFGRTKPAVARERPRLGGFERLAWRLFGARAERRRDPSDALDDRLLQTHARLLPAEYRAVTAALVLVAVGCGAGAAVMLVGSIAASAGLGTDLALLGLLPVGAAGFTYLYREAAPAVFARERARRLDQELGPVANFASAMSLADVRVDEIVRELSAQPLYGEAAEEARWIVRDVDLLGLDILSALREAARRSPSERFREFWQGAVATSESGGELRPYFLQRSEQYEREGDLAAVQGLERMGLFAEAFVTIGVAFPLFVIVLLAALSMVEGASAGLVRLLWATVLGVLPLTLLAFGLASRSAAEGL